MRPRSAVVCVALVAMCLLISGCAITRRTGAVPDEPPWPPTQPDARQAVRVFVHEDWGGTAMSMLDLSSQAVALFSDSRLFRRVMDASSGDRVVEEPDLVVGRGGPGP